jgi:hypothetical protein
MDPNNRLEVPSGQAGKEFCFDINALEKDFVKYTRRKNWYTNIPFTIDQLPVIRKFWLEKLERIPLPSAETSDAERAEYLSQIGRFAVFDDILENLLLVEIKNEDLKERRLENTRLQVAAREAHRVAYERLKLVERRMLVSRNADRFCEKLNNINQKYDYNNKLVENNNEIAKYVRYYGYLLLLFGISVSVDEFLRLVERLFVMNIPLPSF